MAKTYGQKIKILCIMQMLLEKTDEQHPMKVADILAGLEQYGIAAERKSVYADIDALQEFGLDIINRREQPSGYYIGSRDFELAELKLLVDAVQASKFVTEKKSRELIGKLEKLVSKNEAGALQRQVVVTNRIKTENESIYYNVDEIHNAISKNAQIRFRYFVWNVKGEMQLRRDGAFYEVSPWLLTWEDENYYLIAYDGKDQIIKHFRVDKMLEIEPIAKPREGREELENFDIGKYAKKTFGMFAGEEQTVTMVADEALAGVVIDRFGKEVRLRPIEEQKFRFHADVAVSRQFFGWLTGLGAGIEIVAPENVRNEYMEYIEKILEKYHKEENSK